MIVYDKTVLLNDILWSSTVLQNEAEQNTKPLLDLDVNNQLLSKYLTVNAHFIDYWLISSNTILHDWDSWRLPPTELLPWETSTHY